MKCGVPNKVLTTNFIIYFKYINEMWYEHMKMWMIMFGYTNLRNIYIISPLIMRYSTFL